MKKLKVVELFAGVGGFRIGLEETGKFEVIWSNQWEPSTKTQHASLVYENAFGSKGHICEDIEKIPTSEIPDIILRTNSHNKPLPNQGNEYVFEEGFPVDFDIIS